VNLARVRLSVSRRPVVAIAALVLVLAVPASASAGGAAPLPVHVTFAGSGLFHLTNTEGSNRVLDEKLDWTVEYRTLLNPDGTLATATAQPVMAPGTYEFHDDFYGINCAAALSAQPPPTFPGDPFPPPASTPQPQAGGNDVQSITYLSPDPDSAAYSQCGEVGDVEASRAAAGVLDDYLPGVLTARLSPVPRSAFLAGGAALRVERVSDGDAAAQLPASCAESYGIQDPSKCTMRLSWSGTVILDATAACPLILAGPPLSCLPPGGVSARAFEKGLDASAPGAGSVGMTATAARAKGSASASRRRKAKPVVIAKARAKARHAGAVRLRPRLTRAGRRALGHTHRLKVVVRTTFTPKHGHRRVTRFATSLRP
jgi:hypothetical protein